MEADNAFGVESETEVRPARPKTRADCINGPRPCPWVGCRHHLYLNVLPTGTIVLQYPDLEPEELTHSCALDLADEGGITLVDAGRLLGVTRQRVQQIEKEALAKLRKKERPR